MSRIGKRTVNIPANVKVTLDKGVIKASGPLGALELPLRPEVKVVLEGSEINIQRADESRAARSLHGLTRTLIDNMIKGVNEGFEKKLEIIGVGYKADIQGDVVNLSLGYSHPIKYPLPGGVKAAVDKQTLITIKGPDKQLIGQVAADIRALRMPEPYKGKGIKYANEVIRRKAGKAGKAAGGK